MRLSLTLTVCPLGRGLFVCNKTRVHHWHSQVSFVSPLRTSLACAPRGDGPGHSCDRRSAESQVNGGRTESTARLASISGSLRAECSQSNCSPPRTTTATTTRHDPANETNPADELAICSCARDVWARRQSSGRRISWRNSSGRGGAFWSLAGRSHSSRGLQIKLRFARQDSALQPQTGICQHRF